MLISVAWKNVWRNKLRSLVVVFAVMIGLMAGSFGVALVEGLGKKRAKLAIENEISHIQIHHPEFQQNYDAKFDIAETPELISELSSNPEVTALTSRMVVSGMINTSGGNSGAFIYGIDPKKEKQVTNIHSYIQDSVGNYFESDKKNQVLISETTAKKLKLDRYKLTQKTISGLLEAAFPKKDTAALYSILNEQFRSQKDYFNKLRTLINPTLIEEFKFLFIKYSILFKERANIVINLQDHNGQITGDKFRLTGIYKTSNRMFDEMHVFVNKKDLAALTGYDESKPHEIAVMLSDRSLAADYAKVLRDKYPELKIESWGQIDPMIIMMAEYLDIFNYFLIAFILAALSFGIVNTMLMAIMERTKELGMLAAIGMNRKRIFNLVMIETIFLTLVGALIGLGINYLIISYFSEEGIDLTKQYGEAFEALGFDSKFYPEMGLKYYIGITLLVIFAAILSSIYPALKAVKLNPAEAVRTDA